MRRKFLAIRFSEASALTSSGFPEKKNLIMGVAPGDGGKACKLSLRGHLKFRRDSDDFRSYVFFQPPTLNPESRGSL